MVTHGVPQMRATQICCQDRQGRIWMGNHFGAVGLWENGRFTPLPGIATSNVFQVVEDREGNLWIATLDRGLYRLSRQVISVYRRPGVHVQTEPLVLWAWKPGIRPNGQPRTKPPLTHDEFVDIFQKWIDSGAPCPVSSGADELSSSDPTHSLAAQIAKRTQFAGLR